MPKAEEILRKMNREILRKIYSVEGIISRYTKKPERGLFVLLSNRYWANIVKTEGYRLIPARQDCTT
jgi:predicted RNA-binding protein (virulence factor B family)